TDGCKAEIRRGHSRRFHLLKRIVDGLGHQIDVAYDGRATQANPDFCKGRTDLMCPRKLSPLVSQHTLSTQEPTAQGTNTVLRKVYRYSYADARAGTGGRGSYGFGYRKVVEYDGDKMAAAVVDDETQAFTKTELRFINDNFVQAGSLTQRIVTSGQPS